VRIPEIIVVTAQEPPNNYTGGAMGKMIDAQSIYIATAATNEVGQEGSIFRFVFWHSVALASIVGVIVTLYAYVPPIHPKRSVIRPLTAVEVSL